MPFTRRHLPQWIPEEAAVFVTWRLAGSRPSLAHDTNRSCEGRRPLLQQGERLDRVRFGPAWLLDSRVAGMVVSALLYGETVRRSYELHA
jgi:hypothetical protein